MEHNLYARVTYPVHDVLERIVERVVLIVDVFGRLRVDERLAVSRDFYRGAVSALRDLSDLFWARVPGPEGVVVEYMKCRRRRVLDDVEAVGDKRRWAVNRDAGRIKIVNDIGEYFIARQVLGR